MNNKRVAFLTLGCKVNSYETDAMEKLFKDAGYTIINFDEKADIYIINTCSVTNMADRKSRQMIHRAKKNNPNAVVVATGCYVQAAKQDALEDKGIDLIVGNNKKKEIVGIVERYFNLKNKENLNGENIEVIDINDAELNIQYEDMQISETDENTRAYIKIQDGCNQFCSYCIIPYVRGRIRSRKLESILEEVENLARNGYKEVVLTGIHISSYGLDFEKEKVKGFKYEYLLEVVEAIAKNDSIKRIRLGSLEPRIISDEFISKLSKIDKVCPHFHLSLQSGNDETLKRMNRKYSTTEFALKCDILRKYYENPAITTDVIVGFVGETEEEFEQTVSFLEKINFSQMHIFKYSIRKGTVAAKMKNHINDQIKTKRSKILLQIDEENSDKYRKMFINNIEKVLFEERIEYNDKMYYVGHNERYLKVIVEVDNAIDLNNQILPVEIKNTIGKDMLIGELV